MPGALLRDGALGSPSSCFDGGVGIARRDEAFDHTGGACLGGVRAAQRLLYQVEMEAALPDENEHGFAVCVGAGDGAPPCYRLQSREYPQGVVFEAPGRNLLGGSSHMCRYHPAPTASTDLTGWTKDGL